MRSRTLRGAIQNAFRPVRARLSLESLEERSLLSASSLLPATPVGDILVGYHTGGTDVVKTIPLAPGTSLDQALAAYRAAPGVAFAEPDYQVHAAVIPNDPYFSNLYGLNNTGQSGGTAGDDIKAPAAWDITTGSTKTVVGVIDSGMDYTHIDLY